MRRSRELGWLEMLDGRAARRGRDRVHRARRERTAPRPRSTTWSRPRSGLQPRADLAVLLPPFGTWDDARPHRRRALPAHGLATARVATPRELLVVCNAGSDARVGHRSRVDAPKCGRCAASIPTPGFTSSSSTLDLDGRRRRLEPRPLGRPRSPPAGARSRTRSPGACRTMLDLACAHAVERVQFGRPIASFQAVRHRLAEALVAVEALDATLGAAADEPGRADRRARQGDGRAHRPHRRRALPAGARGHRLHHRPPVPPLPQADDGARRPVRLGRRHRGRHRAPAARRRAASRRSSSCETRRPGATAGRSRDRLRRRSTSSATTTFVADPYPYFEHLRGAVPGAARAAPRRRDGHGLRRSDRGTARHRDVLVVQLGDRTLPRVPGPARRRRRERAHRAAPRRAAVQRPAADARPAGAHRAPRAC